ncbi:MAG TPA: hypothetical protein VNN17_13430 [Terriglobia bacterium]|nr:hypothetical protein [Terriglobia bacterium]
MKTPPPSAIDQLSEPAQLLLHRMLDEQAPPERIAQQLWLQTRADVSAEDITRYAFRYRRRQQELRQMRDGIDAFIRLARRNALSISDLLRAVLLEKLAAAPDPSFQNLDVLKLEAAERLRSGLELRQKQAEAMAAFRKQELALKERQVQVAEGRLQIDRRKAEAFLAALERKASRGRPVTSLDVRRVRELYGLDEAQPEDHAQAKRRDEIQT